MTIKLNVGKKISFAIFCFLLSLVFLVSRGAKMPSDFEVDPEYINGIIAASSVLYGFWFVVIERRPKEKKLIRYYQRTGVTIFFSLVFLIGSVFITYLSALNMIQSTYALSSALFSFGWNALCMTTDLYIYKFGGQAIVSIEDNNEKT